MTAHAESIFWTAHLGIPKITAYSSACSPLPGLKGTAFPGARATAVPVRGLRPMPSLRGRTLKTPNPRSSMRSPRLSASFIPPNTVSTALSAFAFEIPVRLTTSLMISSLIRSPPGAMQLSLLDQRAELRVDDGASGQNRGN